MTRKSGIYNFLDMGRILKRTSDEEGVRAVGFHAQSECLGSALGEPAIIRARDGSYCVLEEAQFVGVGGLVGGEDGCSHYDV